MFALAAKNFMCWLFEKNLSVVRGVGQQRSAIKISSNALVTLEATDTDVAEKVMEVGCIHCARIIGLVDGISGH